jgi:hypothetical protein
MFATPPTHHILRSVLHLNQRDNAYETVIGIHPRPQRSDPLTRYLQHARPAKPSQFTAGEQKCITTIRHPVEQHRVWLAHELPELTAYLQGIGYTVDTDLSRLLRDSGTSREFLLSVKSAP